MAKMAVHMMKVRKGFFGGGEMRGSLCGRLNAASLDGMNITDRRDEVTCQFCLRMLAAQDKRAAA